MRSFLQMQFATSCFDAINAKLQATHVCTFSNFDQGELLRRCPKWLMITSDYSGPTFNETKMMQMTDFDL